MNTEERLAALYATALSFKEGSKLAVFVAQVDPDALASAFGLKFLLKNLLPQLEVKIFYAGSISHPQNRAIVNRFDLAKEMIVISDEPTEKDETFLNSVDTLFALVDSNDAEDNRIGFEIPLNKLKIIIDHHRGHANDSVEQVFFWVEDGGSASSMVAVLIKEFLESSDITKPSKDEDELNKILSLLALGIYTDTKDLKAANENDKEMFSWLTKQGDANLLFVSMLNYPLAESYYVHLAKALENRKTKDARLVTGVGRINPEDGDNLSTIADELIRIDGISLVVVWGIMGNSVRISVRNDNITEPLNDFLQKRFKTGGAKLTPDGRGEGGAKLPLDWLLSPEPDEETLGVLEKLVSMRITKLVFS